MVKTAKTIILAKQLIEVIESLFKISPFLVCGSGTGM
jgi:hypothetical protein